MKDISTRLNALLANRRERLPAIREQIDHWNQLGQQLSALDEAVNGLRTHLRTPDEVKEGLAGFQLEPYRRDISTNINQLRVIEARFARDTINIGVSGQARVGKSTLLQSISGLDDDQIPTGTGLPVTAVRSRIYHSSTVRRATLSRHSFESFREEVLQPYHHELGLSTSPASADEFASWKYEDQPGEDKSTHISILERLKKMQKSFPSYRDELVGGEKVVEFEELRPYVAYETNDQINAGKGSAVYLAVRDVRIECKFPYAQVERIGIIDLPGLGELTPNAERHHLEGLRNEVDLVLFVKRPKEGLAFWNSNDGKAANLLDEARGPINRRDFVFIAVNSSDEDSELKPILLDDIRRGVNDGVDGKHYQVLECDARKQDSVYDHVLQPVLSHLAERLVVMDDAVVGSAQTKCEALSTRILATLRDVEMALKSAHTVTGGDDIYDLAKRLHEDIGQSLHLTVENFHRRVDDVTNESEDEEFMAALDSARDEVQEWISNSFGSDEQQWTDNALRQMRLDNTSMKVAVNQQNSIRVAISKRYGVLDKYFTNCIEGLWDLVAKELKPSLGELLLDLNGRDALEVLQDKFDDAGCIVLADAVRELLSVRLEYRTYLHPKVRRGLDGLGHDIMDPETGGSMKVDEEGAKKLLSELQKRAKQASYATYKALIKEASIPILVLYASAEQFDDALLLDARSEKEFREFAKAYRDELWPGVFKEINDTNIRFAKVRRAIKTVRENPVVAEVGQ